MRETRKDGGLAFPGMRYETILDPDGVECSIPVNYPGLSIRDYFAGQALSGLYACRELQQGTIEDHRMPIESFEAVMAAQAYAQADAMLKAREA